MNFFERVREAYEDPDGGTSMTRVIASMFAVVVCFGIVVMAAQNHLHEAGWPFAAIVAVIVLAVPLQALFRALTEWLKSGPGRRLLTKLLNKAAGIEPDVSTSATATVTTSEGE